MNAAFSHLRYAKAWVALALCAGLLAPTAADAQAIILRPGEVSPSHGVFLPAADAIAAANMLDRYQRLVDRVGALEQQARDQDEKVALLEASLGSGERELAIKDLIIKHKDEMLAFRKEINDEYKALIAETRATLLSDKTTIERLERRIESLEKRGFWTAFVTVVGGILGAAAFLLMR